MNKNISPLIAIVIWILTISITGCGQKANKAETPKQVLPRGSFQSNIKGMVEIQTADAYIRPISKGFGFFVDKETVVTNLDLIQGAYRAKIAAPGTTQFYEVEGYTNYNLHLNLVLLKVKRRNENFLKIVEPPQNTDTLYTLLRPKRDLFISRSAVQVHQSKDSSSFFKLRSELEAGKPAFFSDHALVGIIQHQKISGDSSSAVVLDAKWINDLLQHQHAPKPLIGLSFKSAKVYISHKNVSGFKINTTMGNFVIRLFDETPAYRDNFIKLVSDDFYDSLLVHRIIKDFLIQTGAADTRNAGRDDVVGWQGPGYSIPMKVVPGIFHRRGAVSASKLPSERNPRNFSDGSQFFVVCGRLFNDKELDDLEKEKGIKFTSEQRNVYKTIGGAPYLDGDYTVFGEVVSGMEVVDKIASLKVYNVDRPEADVRIRNIEILKK
jgi:cyclophilin family peptidyl-prolyl cis-trans isomerase